jgi:hypothetical protein
MLTTVRNYGCKIFIVKTLGAILIRVEKSFIVLALGNGALMNSWLADWSLAAKNKEKLEDLKHPQLSIVGSYKPVVKGSFKAYLRVSLISH